MTRPAKRITSSDVARAAGVSRTTVSFVLNDKPGQSISEATRQRVLETARRMDYHPHASARNLAMGRSDIVLLSLPDLPIGSSVSRFVEQFATSLARSGLTLVCHFGDYGHSGAYGHLAGAYGRPLPDVCATVDASVVVGLEPFDDDTAAALYRAGADVVLATGAEITITMQQIGRLQGEHLIGHGHRRIGYARPGQGAPQRIADERLRGACDACAEAGLDPPVTLSTDLDMASAERAVTHWTQEAVTGICAYNDETAMAVLAGIRSRGLAIPGDLAVIGADDIPTAPLTAPPLTTVAFDFTEAGRHLAEAVVAGLAGNKPELTPRSARPRVVQRSST